MMLPRTTHHDFNVQMQIHENKGFPQILYGVNLDEDLRSISLERGHEYLIELQPYGQVSSEDFNIKAITFLNAFADYFAKVEKKRRFMFTPIQVRVSMMSRQA